MPPPRLRERRVLWPSDFDAKLMSLWERSKTEDSKTPVSFQEFVIGLVVAGYAMLEASLERRKGGTSLVQPAAVMPKLEGQYVGRR